MTQKAQPQRSEPESPPKTDPAPQSRECLLLAPWQLPSAFSVVSFFFCSVDAQLTEIWFIHLNVGFVGWASGQDRWLDCARPFWGDTPSLRPSSLDTGGTLAAVADARGPGHVRRQWAVPRVHALGERRPPHRGVAGLLCDHAQRGPALWRCALFPTSGTCVVVCLLNLLTPVGLSYARNFWVPLPR